MCLCRSERLNFRNGTAKSSINTGRYTVDYLLCGDLPYPAWKKRVSAQDLRNRRIRRYFVCRLKRSEARDFSHVRFTKCSKHMLFHLRQTVFILFLAVQINLHIRVCRQLLLIRVIVAHIFVQACHLFHFFLGEFEIENI